MKKTIDFSDFRQAFIDYNRVDNFSAEGLAELYDGLIQLEEDTNQELELDVIGLCCDFRESTIEEINNDYNQDSVDIEDPVILAAAKRLGVHPAVICVKWAAQRGQIPIPFSVINWQL